MAKSTAIILKQIDSIKNRGARLDKDIQDSAVDILEHVAEHREVTLVNKLFQAMPNGARRNALAEWFLAFGMIEVNRDKKESKERPFIFDKNGLTRLDAAKVTMWYEFKKEKAVAEEFDLNHKLLTLNNQLQKAINQGTLGANVDDATLADLQRIIQRINNAKAAEVDKGDNNA